MIIPVPDPHRDFDHPLLGHTEGKDPSATEFDPAQQGLPADPSRPPSGTADPIPSMRSGFEVTQG